MVCAFAFPKIITMCLCVSVWVCVGVCQCVCICVRNMCVRVSVCLRERAPMNWKADSQLKAKGTRTKMTGGKGSAAEVNIEVTSSHSCFLSLWTPKNICCQGPGVHWDLAQLHRCGSHSSNPSPLILPRSVLIPCFLFRGLFYEAISNNRLRKPVLHLPWTHSMGSKEAL